MNDKTLQATGFATLFAGILLNLVASSNALRIVAIVLLIVAVACFVMLMVRQRRR